MGPKRFACRSRLKTDPSRRSGIASVSTCRTAPAGQTAPPGIPPGDPEYTNSVQQCGPLAAELSNNRFRVLPGANRNDLSATSPIMFVRVRRLQNDRRMGEARAAEGVRFAGGSEAHLWVSAEQCEGVDLAELIPQLFQADCSFAISF